MIAQMLVAAVRIAERAIGRPRCRVCGCTEHAACPGGCAWVEPDLCSRCSDENLLWELR